MQHGGELWPGDAMRSQQEPQTMGGAGGKVSWGRLAKHFVIRGQQDRGGCGRRWKARGAVRQRELPAINGRGVTEEGSCVNFPLFTYHLDSSGFAESNLLKPLTLWSIIACSIVLTNPVWGL